MTVDGSAMQPADVKWEMSSSTHGVYRMWLIRQMRDGDMHKVEDIWLKTSIDEYAFVPEHLQQDPTEYWKTRLPQMTADTRAADGYVYESDGEIAGFMTLKPATGYIFELFVDSLFQGKGIGTALIKAAKSLRPYVRAHVYQKKDDAVRFYKKHQFYECSKHTECETQQVKLRMEWRMGELPDGQRKGLSYGEPQ